MRILAKTIIICCYLVSLLIAHPTEKDLLNQELQLTKPEESGFSSARLNKLDYFKSLVGKKEIAGVVCLIARWDEVVYFQSFGDRKIEKELKMTNYAIFDIASMTKPFTSVAAMMLYEEGYYDLIALQELREAAEEENWLVVFPNGRITTDNRNGECLWNAVHCCGFAYKQNVDDVGFVQKLLETLQRKYKIDEKKSYATGRSNGGMLVPRLGAELGDIFAAIAPFAASAGGQFDDTSSEIIAEPNKPLPILVMHGLNDASVKYYGGLSSNGIRYDISFAKTSMLWIANNSCDQAVADTTVFDSDKGRTWIVDYRSCQDEAQVVAITV